MRFPTKISEDTFKFGRMFQPGWGDLNISERKVMITAKGQAGCLSQFFLGMIIAGAVAGSTTLNIPYSRILDVKVSGKKLTLVFQDTKGKHQRIYLKPYRSKGFLGGKVSQAQEVAEMIQEHCAA